MDNGYLRTPASQSSPAGLQPRSAAAFPFSSFQCVGRLISLSTQVGHQEDFCGRSVKPQQLPLLTPVERHRAIQHLVSGQFWGMSAVDNSRLDIRGEVIQPQLAVRVGGSVTGHGADLIVVDDLMKANEVHSEAAREEARRWFDNSLVTRLNTKKTGSIVSIQQRLHEDDLPAYLLEKGYDHLNLPAIGETVEAFEIGGGRVHRRQRGELLNAEREDKAVLDLLRRELGPQVFSAQYQQNPVAPEGNLIRLEWFGRYQSPVERHMVLKVVQSWDTAMSSAPTSDYSVCTTWGFREGRWWLLDVYRERLDYPDLKRAVIRLQREWSAEKVIIEDANCGKSLYQEMRISGPFVPILMTPREDKETRLTGQTGRLEEGLCLLPEGAPWLDAFCAELKAFPSGRYADQVDSLTQFLQFEHHNWRWALEERNEKGRLLRPVRLKRRPPLPQRC